MEKSFDDLQLALDELKRSNDKKNEKRVMNCYQSLLRIASLEPMDENVQRICQNAHESLLKMTAPTTMRGSMTAYSYPVWFVSCENQNYTYGKVDVLIPSNHRFGEQGTPIFKRIFRLEIQSDYLKCNSTQTLESSEEFYDEISERLKLMRSEKLPEHVLLFIHGYNTSRENASLSASQLGFDLQFSATVFFHWPSHGAAPWYTADEAAIERSEFHLQRFLVELRKNLPETPIHVLAHSMGNRGLLRALQRLDGTREELTFSRFILAAPDVDRGLFENLHELYSKYSSLQPNMYISKWDKALYLSSKLHWAPRAGHYQSEKELVSFSNIQTIILPDFGEDFLSHSYFKNAKPILYDIFALVHDTERLRIRKLPGSLGDSMIWKFDR